ncbi:MAG TPA: hypothetical protein VM933_04815 [Acidimicrobiales bacterium]|nr:hypothetical protein [Acidimicrobiales bacterium]
MTRRLPALLLAAALAATGACSRDDEDRRARAAATTTTAVPGPPTLQLAVTGLDPHGTKPPDEATIAAVKATLDRWLADAVVAPLFSGQPAGDLSAVFTPAALERLAADPAARATLVDEGLPPATTRITAERATATLASVAGADEVVAIVAAQIDLGLHVVGPTLDVDVNHYGEVVLVQEPDGWKIDAFAMETARDSRAA